jgi:DNA-binding transcriptional ArsR family regulator
MNICSYVCVMIATKTSIDVEKLEKVAFILKTIAHPLRIGIIDLLTDTERMSVNDICKKLDSEQSLTSHHLSNMKLKGILRSERQGKNIYYSLKMKEVTEVIQCMQNCNLIMP